LHSAYGNWLTLVVFLTEGLALGAFIDRWDTALPAGVLALGVAVPVMRRVRRAIRLFQELRADAEACSPTVSTDVSSTIGFEQALAALPVSDRRELRQRLAALTRDGHRHLVRRTRLLLWSGWCCYVGVTLAGFVAAAVIMLAEGPGAVLTSTR